MKKLNLIAACACMLAMNASFGQTNPEPHDLSVGDFSFTGFAFDTIIEYPASTQGWNFATEPTSSEVGAATNDRALVPQSALFTSGNFRNEGENGLSIRNSGPANIGAFALALNTVNRENITVSFTTEDIATGATRQNGILLQYRIGTEGNFTTVENTTYMSDPTDFKAAQTFTDVALPEAVNNAPVVQLRWLYFYEAGGGARDRIRLDDITVSSEAAAAATVDVTFRVDMSEFVGVINPAGMHIAGSFPTDTWNPAARQMTNEGDGIWSWTEALEPGFALEYKYVRGPDWSDGDENMTGLPCGAPGTSNRALTVPNEDTELPAFCYGSCQPCNIMAETSAVTFQVDMSQETIAAEGVGISGSFNGFAFEPMVDEGGGIYSYTIDLAQESTIEYKFRNGDAFETPPALCGTGGFGNRVLTVPMEDLILGVVCYSSCEACDEPGESFTLILQVDASDIVVDAAGMFIAGSFNGFIPEAMVDTGDGVYSFTAEVEEGSTVTYKFLNGESFDGVETVPQACGSDDGFGGFNRNFVMPSVNTTLDAVCFGSCNACGVIITDFTLTLQVDASQIAIHPEGMRIAGTFNGFNPAPMVNAGGGLYTFTTVITAGSIVRWKFVNSTDFTGVELVPSECGVPDGFGGFNRDFLMPAMDFTFEAVCFSSCSACPPPSEIFELTFQLSTSDLSEVNPEGIHIAGSFNGFTPQAMVDAGDNLYTFTANIAGGATVLWKYIDGSNFSSAAENVPAACGVDDLFGGFNRNFIMPNANTTLPSVCFSSCVACTTDNVLNASKHKQFQLYPNPNNGTFTLVSPATGMLDMRVYDLTGRLVHSNRLNTAEGAAVTYTQAMLEKGYYLVELRYAEAAYSARIIVE